jgi:hypothetical protein
MSPDCHRAFDREVLVSLLPKSFINTTLKRHRERCLLERETAMLPATQVYVQQEQQRRANMRVIDQLREEANRLRNQLRENQRAMYRVAQQATPNLGDVSATHFVQRCAAEGCRGWLSTAWKCTVCERYSCSDCHGLKRSRDDPDHACDPNAVETVKLLGRDSRKCPQCGVYITKIDGCDQMFCTQCHKAFSWRTGRIINGTIHNPHYFEALARGGIQPGRAHGDVPCGGLPTVRELHEALHNVDSLFAMRIMRLVLHIQQVERARFPTEPREDTNVDLRVRFSLGELGDDEFRTKLQRREKEAQKKKEFGDVLEMLEHTLSDELRRVVVDKNVVTLKTRAVALVEYANEACNRISRRYDCRGIQICSTRMRVLVRTPGDRV